MLVNVLNHYCAGLGAVAAPKFRAVDQIVGPEEESVINVGQGIVQGAAVWVNVCDHGGAASRAIASPELYAMHAVVGAKEERAVQIT